MSKETKHRAVGSIYPGGPDQIKLTHTRFLPPKWREQAATLNTILNTLHQYHHSFQFMMAPAVIGLVPTGVSARKTVDRVSPATP